MENNQEYITKQCIIEEYLNNWFTYEELASYLCISLQEVKETIDTCLKLDDKTSQKISRHSELINRYYENPNATKVNYDVSDYKALEIAKYMVENASSVRETARNFGLGKTTVHEYIHERLPEISIKLYKEVFDILMANKSFSTNNKQVIDQVLKSYDLLATGLSSKEIQEKLGLSRNVLQRNLTTRLKKIDKDKYKLAQEILLENQMLPLRENEFKSNAK